MTSGSGDRSVAASGMYRANAGRYETTQQRPTYCLVLISIRGNVRP